MYDFYFIVWGCSESGEGSPVASVHSGKGVGKEVRWQNPYGYVL